MNKEIFQCGSEDPLSVEVSPFSLPYNYNRQAEKNYNIISMRNGNEPYRNLTFCKEPITD